MAELIPLGALYQCSLCKSILKSLSVVRSHVCPKLQQNHQRPNQCNSTGEMSKISNAGVSIKNQCQTPITTRMTPKSNTAVTSSDQSSNWLVNNTPTNNKSRSLISSACQSLKSTITGKIN